MNDTSISVPLRFTKFSLLLSFAIPSTFSATYIIYSSIRFPSIRRRFYYEILVFLCFLVLLKIIFDITISLSYYSRGYVLIQTHHFCRFWQYIDYTLTGCILWCNAIFVIERYLLVFYPQYLRSKRQKILFHYSPIILSNVYVVIFYIYSIIIITCSNSNLYHRHLCGSACVDSNRSLSAFNWLFNILLPVFIIIFGSFILLIQVLWTRRKMQRNLRNWSKNWKMIIQLLGIAVVYTLVWLPLSVVSMMSTFIEPINLEIFTENYMYFLTYIADMCVPIVALVFSPEIHHRLRNRAQPSVTIISTGPTTYG